MGGNTPFGYDSNRISIDGKKISRLVPNERASQLQELFKQFESGESLYSICHDLNGRNIKTANGNAWSPNAVKRVLQNISPSCADEMMYNYLVATGYTVSNGKDEFDGQHGMCLFYKNKNRNQSTEISEQVAVIGLHESIITSEQYIIVQRMLISNERSVNTQKRSSRTFLSGLVWCAECGYSFGVIYTERNGKSYAYYRCRGRESRGACDNAVYISTGELEDHVVHACLDHLKKFSLDSKSVAPQNISGHAIKVEQLQKQIQNLIDNIAKGNAVVDDLLTQKIVALQDQIKTVTSTARASSHGTSMDKKTISGIIHQFQHFEELTINQKTDQIRGVVKTIKIDSDQRIEIVYLF